MSSVFKTDQQHALNLCVAYIKLFSNAHRHAAVFDLFLTTTDFNEPLSNELLLLDIKTNCVFMALFFLPAVGIIIIITLIIMLLLRCL